MLQFQNFKSLQLSVEAAVDPSKFSAILDWTMDMLHVQNTANETALAEDYETSLDTFEKTLGILGMYLLTESGDEEQIPEITKGGSLEVSEEIIPGLAMHYYVVSDAGGYVFFIPTTEQEIQQ